ncbi:Cyclic pyranopterin monophosphate synthase [Planctomycetes bacterium Pan216]|uniref:GTP 3',8-cyclase n=1 Tax=Kolteria novifilia TaxID=2527975 RepID=A0A518BAT7_9BACT|nr:Cyclic pyranopterin monophosphate synthase [Planctomycetes bacterium Pan216]
MSERRALPLIDSFGRRHNNLRISVTDRCNFRCTYCMPEDVTFLPQQHLMSFEEIARFAHIAAGRGVDKIRLTGGEPLLRRELHKLVAMLTSIPGIKEVGLTTNGLLLGEHASSLVEAGLRRLNVSLDTLDRDQFRRIARRDGLEKVLDGIERARVVGFGPIKVNAVAMKGSNEDQVVPLARYCRERGLELRFIEYMPLEAEETWQRGQVLTAAQLRDMLAEAGMPTQPIPRSDPSAPATDFEYTDGKGRLGIIASVSEPFCQSCNRIRLTAEGKLRNCLFALEEVDIKTPMRQGASDAEIASLIEGNVVDKWEGHQINSAGYVRPPRTMHTIGG